MTVPAVMILLPLWVAKHLDRKARLEFVYEVIGELAEMRGRKALLLSGGQQKLVALGRALGIGTKFLLLDDVHKVEYAAPLRFGGRTKGALIVAFDKREDCDDTVCRLVDAAAQQAALAAHISSLYQAARDASAAR